MAADRILIDAVRGELRRRADPQRAPGMQAYMKSAMPYAGVRVPAVRVIVRAAAHRRPPTDLDALTATVRTLWDEAQVREERYAATALLAAPAVRTLRRPQLITLYAGLIVAGAWWDHVDELAHRVGELLVAFPDEVTPVVRGWYADADMWLRRASIICQIGLKERTDLALLTDAIEGNAGEREFFLRKAIGWALRDYARTDPDWVRAFVAGHDLQPLSVREATKHL